MAERSTEMPVDLDRAHWPTKEEEDDDWYAPSVPPIDTSCRVGESAAAPQGGPFPVPDPAPPRRPVYNQRVEIPPAIRRLEGEAGAFAAGVKKLSRTGRPAAVARVLEPEDPSEEGAADPGPAIPQTPGLPPSVPTCNVVLKPQVYQSVGNTYYLPWKLPSGNSAPPVEPSGAQVESMEAAQSSVGATCSDAEEPDTGTRASRQRQLSEMEARGRTCLSRAGQVLLRRYVESQEASH